ncbi:MAG: TlpA family protein disulfide reductase [Ginsengibacter sp.]
MNLNDLTFKIKKHWINLLLFTLLGIFIFSPAAKSWLLKQLVSTGLFNAEIIKDKNGLSIPPSFSFTDTTGKTLSTADLKGKVVFINFWASWCPPCRAEMSSLNQLYLELRGNKKFFFLFINEDEDPSKAKKYMGKDNLSIPFYSQAGDISPEIFNGTLPTTVILDKEGKMVLNHRGMAKYNTDEFIRELNAL